LLLFKSNRKTTALLDNEDLGWSENKPEAEFISRWPVILLWCHTLMSGLSLEWLFVQRGSNVLYGN